MLFSLVVSHLYNSNMHTSAASCMGLSLWGQDSTNTSTTHMHLPLAMPAAAANPTRPKVVLLVIFSLTLWLLGAVSGLLLPILLQRAASFWRSATGSDADSCVSSDASLQVAPGLQSRPLSDVDPEEVLDDDPLLLHSSQHGAALLLASSASQGLTPHWQVTEADLQRFKAAVDPIKGRLLTGDLGVGWNFIMEKEQPGRMRYLSYWRPTANDKTDYLSITLINGTTAQEMQEFNLDDASRVRWDPMLKAAWLLQSGRDVASSCEQMVAYLRSFPMGFVSDRLYAGISRREFSDPQQPGCLWGVSKVVHTPTTAAWAAVNYPGVTMADDYFSAWECRTILSPWADAATGPNAEPQPACALILFHHDDLKVPEYLARTAIKLGMWRFVQGMVSYADKWLQQRSARVDPFTPDPQAAGRQPALPLSPDVAAAAAAVAHRHVPYEAAAALATSSFGQDTAGVAAAAAAAADAAAAAAAGVQSAGPAGPARSLANSAAGSSWAGFREAEAEAATPRVLLHTVPTAPGPLNLMAAASDSGVPGAIEGLVRQHSGGGAVGTGVLVQDKGLLRRGHSLEWEPRMQSSRSSSIVSGRESGGTLAAANAAPVVGTTSSSRWQQVKHAAGNAVKQPVESGLAAVSAACSAGLQLLQAVGTALPGKGLVSATEGQQVHNGDPQHSQGAGAAAAGTACGSSGSKLPAAARLAPAGPEDAATDTPQHPLSSSSSSRTAFAAQGDMSAAACSHGSSQRRPHKPGRRRLQRLLVAAGAAAALGAGVASYRRRRRVAAHKAVEQQVVEQPRQQQQGRGLLPRAF